MVLNARLRRKPGTGKPCKGTSVTNRTGRASFLAWVRPPPIERPIDRVGKRSECTTPPPGDTFVHLESPPKLRRRSGCDSENVSLAVANGSPTGSTHPGGTPVALNPRGPPLESQKSRKTRWLTWHCGRSIRILASTGIHRADDSDAPKLNGSPRMITSPRGTEARAGGVGGIQAAS